MKRFRAAGLPAAVLALAFGAGCAGDAPPTETAGPRHYDPAAATATIFVRATARGPLPKMRAINFDVDAHCASLHAGETVYDPTIVEKDGHLANVVAWVSRGAERWAHAAPTAQVVLEQRGCMLEPHVFSIGVNQPLTIRSGPMGHSIHAKPRINLEFNHPQLKGGPDVSEKFEHEEVGIQLGCDVHGWMRSWASVFSHPFHGVTDHEGLAMLRVPPGDYEVSAWHEYPKFGKPAPQQLKVADGETKEVEFVYEVAK